MDKVQKQDVGRVEERVGETAVSPTNSPLHRSAATQVVNGGGLRARARQAKVLQRQIGNQQYGLLDSSMQKKTNDTGLPDNLKAGVESLSGLSMDGVKVHYNSARPAQMQAHAYAQGTDIHLAAGQEKYLPHEAWHVVQQMQGRVQPTLQAKGVLINDDAGLEQEADVMGTKALQMRRPNQVTTDLATTVEHEQRAERDARSARLHRPKSRVVQRAKTFTTWLAAQAAPPATLAQMRGQYIGTLNAEYDLARVFLGTIPNHGAAVSALLRAERIAAFAAANLAGATAAFDRLAGWVTRVLEIKKIFALSREARDATPVANQTQEGVAALTVALGQLNGVTAANLQGELDTIRDMAVARTDAMFNAMNTMEFLAFLDTTAGEGAGGNTLDNAPNGLPIYSVPFEPGQLPSALMQLIRNVRAAAGVLGAHYGFDQNGVPQNRSVSTHNAGDMRSWHDDEGNALLRADGGAAILGAGAQGRRTAYENLYLAEFRAREGQQNPLLERNDAELLARLGRGAPADLRSAHAPTRKAAFVVARNALTDVDIQTHHEKGFIEINADGWNQASQLGRIIFDYRNDRFYLTGGHYNNFKMAAGGQLVRETDANYGQVGGNVRNHAFHINV